MAERELLEALRELYCAFGSDADPVVSDWWEAMAEDSASHDDFHRDSSWYRREALARAREVLMAADAAAFSASMVEA